MSHILTPPPTDLRYNVQISLKGGSGFQFITTNSPEQAAAEVARALGAGDRAIFPVANIANHSKGECRIWPEEIVGWLIAPIVLTPDQMRQVAAMQSQSMGGPALS